MFCGNEIQFSDFIFIPSLELEVPRMYCDTDQRSILIWDEKRVLLLVPAYKNKLISYFDRQLVCCLG